MSRVTTGFIQLMYDRELRRAMQSTAIALAVISMLYHTVFPISAATGRGTIGLVKAAVDTSIVAASLVLAFAIAFVIHDSVSYRMIRGVSTVLVIALLLCQVALPVSANGDGPGDGGDGGGGGGIGQGLASLVKMAVDALIVVGGLALAFAIAFTGVSTIFAKMAGMPYAEAQATMKIIGVVIAFIVTAFAIPVANAVIDNVMEYQSGESIHVPQT